jgi:hypothetical protein
MAYRWSEKNQITLITLKSVFYSCKFSYLELEPDETDGTLFNLIDIYIYIPANGCIGSRLGVLLCPGPIYKIKCYFL